MTYKTLITPIEVIELSGISSQFPTCDLRVIRNAERQEFRECLGIAWYNALIADLADYSSESEFVNGTTYNLGNVVLFEGVYYQALTTTTELPTVTTDWELAPKFTTVCNNNLWCEAMGGYLSLIIVKNRLPFIATKITAQGIVKTATQDLIPADAKDVSRIATALDTNIAIGLEELHDYVISNNDDGCYNLYKGIAVDCCNSCGCLEEECKCSAPCLNAKKSKNRYNVG